MLGRAELVRLVILQYQLYGTQGTDRNGSTSDLVTNNTTGSPVIRTLLLVDIYEPTKSLLSSSKLGTETHIFI